MELVARVLLHVLVVSQDRRERRAVPRRGCGLQGRGAGREPVQGGGEGGKGGGEAAGGGPGAGDVDVGGADLHPGRRCRAGSGRLGGCGRCALRPAGSGGGGGCEEVEGEV